MLFMNECMDIEFSLVMRCLKILTNSSSKKINVQYAHAGRCLCANPKEPPLHDASLSNFQSSKSGFALLEENGEIVEKTVPSRKHDKYFLPLYVRLPSVNISSLSLFSPHSPVRPLTLSEKKDLKCKLPTFHFSICLAIVVHFIHPSKKNPTKTEAQKKGEEKRERES